MKKSSSMKKTAKQRSARFSKVAVVLCLVALAVALVAFLSMTRQNSSASTSMPQNGNSKRYKATRPIVVDQQSGQLRMPTQQETDKVVADLSTLAKRPTDGLQQTTVANSGVALDLDGGYGGVMLARPKGDGTWETKCVFTFEEGVEFLGLEEEV
jgi:hypothetical protein